MSIALVIKSLKSERENFKKNKKTKSRWLKHPKYEASKSYLLPHLNKVKKQNFRKVKISDKLVDYPSDQNQSMPLGLSTVIVLPNGVRVENISEEVLVRLLNVI